MKKTQLIITLLISVIAVLGILGVKYYLAGPYGAINYKDASFVLDGKPITMTSAGIKYFGNETVGDFNNDGQADVSFLFTYDGGGSGTFYYIATSLGSANGFFGTNSILIGDRIAPQATEFRDGKIIVNYADRWPGQPFTSEPSMGVSKYFSVSNRILTELFQ